MLWFVNCVLAKQNFGLCRQCSAYAGFAQGCLDPSVTDTDECSCKKEVMDAFLSCVP